MEQTEFSFHRIMPSESDPTMDYRKHLLDKARVLGVNIVHVFDPDYPKGGLTIAFRKVSRFKSGKMVECAVATCSRLDAFNKKLGTQLALEKFFNSETICLPMLETNAEEDLNKVVKRCFYYIWVYC